jgi:hypothetical protein
MTRAAQDYPDAVQQACRGYLGKLCGLLQLRPPAAAAPALQQQQQQQQQPSCQATRQPASQVASARQSATQLRLPAAPAPPVAGGKLQLPSGEEFGVLQDLLDALLPLPGSYHPAAAAPAVAFQEAALQPQGAPPQPGSTRCASPKPSAGAGSARGGAAKGKPLSKQQQEEAAAQAEAEAEALAAAAAVAAAEAARLAELSRPPAALDGQPLCLALELPRPQLSAALRQLQVSTF